MGLSISKLLTDLLGGNLSFESEFGNGTVFYVTIPCKTGNGEAIQQPEDIDWCDQLSQASVLIVEDDVISLMYFKEVAEMNGMNTYTTTSAQEAIEIVHANTHIDMVIMDEQLPDMNGKDALKKMKSIRHDLPVILQTGYVNHFNDKAEEGVWDDFMLKPIAQQDLCEKMAKHLKK
jgi:CheY-like chemotaxis protein